MCHHYGWRVRSGERSPIRQPRLTTRVVGRDRPRLSSRTCAVARELLKALVEEASMRTSFLALALVGALGFATGCSSSSTRAVSGQLRVDTSTMNHPVVIAQSSDHRVFVAGVTASGRFTLQLPAGVAYRMTL